MEMLLRFLHGTTAVMAVPRRSWRCRGDPTADWPNPRWPADVLNMFNVSAVPPRRSAVLTVFRGATAITDGTLRNHGDYGGATAVYAVQAPP